jgi:hypothetical protein
MERNRPVRAGDSDLIRASFKPEYYEPIRDWLLIQTDKKREELYNFLKGKRAKRPGTRTTGRPFNLQWNPQRSVDLVAETSSSKVDFNRAIYGPPPWQLDPRALMPTHIDREGIFGFREPYGTHDTHDGGPGKYNEFVLSVMLKPHVAMSIYHLADDYAALSEELLKWTEKKTMKYPIDPVKDIPLLRTTAQARMMKEKLEEDHFWEPGHKPVRKTRVARDLKRIGPGGGRGEVRSMMSTRYRDVFCDEVHEDYLRSGPPPVTPSLKQVENSCPYGLFPEVPPVPLTGLPELMRQAAANRAQGQLNKQILSGPTCL